MVFFLFFFNVVPTRNLKKTTTKNTQPRIFLVFLQVASRANFSLGLKKNYFALFKGSQKPIAGNCKKKNFRNCMHPIPSLSKTLSSDFPFIKGDLQDMCHSFTDWLVQGYTPLGHCLVLLIFILSLILIFALMWFFVSSKNLFFLHLFFRHSFFHLFYSSTNSLIHLYIYSSIFLLIKSIQLWFIFIFFH